jgi:hypothetical protein
MKSLANSAPKVMAGLDPAIQPLNENFWMAASRAAMTIVTAETQE